jgi:GH25 family lysozyme M1 (1,4-beta-N-acetylmuramidase)
MKPQRRHVSPATGNTANPGDPLLLLPDISEYQPNANLDGIKVMNGGAVILRAAYGAGHPDAAFAKHRAAAAAAGFSFVGIYQYLVAGQDAAAQAEAFCRITGKLAPHETAILDLEEGTGNQAVRAAIWLTYVDNAVGRAAWPLDCRSWVYSGEDYAETHGLAELFASPRRTWVAAYGDTEPSLGHTLWQCTDGTTGPHVTNWPGAGNCDTNLYHGTLAQLAATIVPPKP